MSSKRLGEAETSITPRKRLCKGLYWVLEAQRKLIIKSVLGEGGRDAGRERGSKKGERKEFFIPVRKRRLMEIKGHFLAFASCRLKGDEGALLLIDGLAEFASYTVEARLVGDSFDPGPGKSFPLPAGKCHGKMPPRTRSAQHRMGCALAGKLCAEGW